MRQVSFDFRDFTALVSGGASGMGAQVARLFAGAGADVVIVDANRALAEQIARELGATAIIGDVSDGAFCEDAIAQSVRRTGRLNAVVNAAGTIARKTGLDTQDADWQRVMGVNAGGVVYVDGGFSAQ